MDMKHVSIAETWTEIYYFLSVVSLSGDKLLRKQLKPLIKLRKNFLQGELIKGNLKVNNTWNEYTNNMVA